MFLQRKNACSIHAMRIKAGLNIKGLAELLHAPYRTVQDWNAGKRMPPKWMQKLIVEKIETTA
jgi:DNA-binding transcriptional regulator YiaG